MSRIGLQPVPIPEGAAVSVQDSIVTVKGAKGELSFSLPQSIFVEISDATIFVKRSGNDPRERSLHGLSRSLINNMVTGVTKGFAKRLDLVGTGYRAERKGEGLELSLGFSHKVTVAPMGFNTLQVEGNTTIIVSGPSKETVGEQAARIRKLRKPNPYKGIGVRYSDEVIRRKAGKTGAK